MTDENSDVVRKAEEFATNAHAGQFQNNKEHHPFIVHPRAVVELVERSGATVEEIAAAWLHDVVEDTSVTLEDITREFGSAIAKIVDGLTDPPHFAGNPNRIRKRWQAERIRDKSASVKRIKIADQTVNTSFMSMTPPLHYTAEMCREYIEGAKKIVDECVGVSEFLEEIFAKAYEEATRAMQ